jgi:hypothetical protein
MATWTGAAEDIPILPLHSGQHMALLKLKHESLCCRQSREFIEPGTFVKMQALSPAVHPGLFSPNPKVASSYIQ